ncbi:hypothetical protein B0H11DRAFT_1932040 [Mycena galericulata]|nr:hypothetical protein B0H11DRAFT_1932040 [Mycena galericulata]
MLLITGRDTYQGSLAIPSSVLDYHLSVPGGRLHFRYSAAAELARLREDGTRLTRQLERAKEDGQRLENENERLRTDLSTLQSQNAHAAYEMQKARDAQTHAEERVQAIWIVNTRLQTDLEAARWALAAERARTVSAVSAIGRLKAEREVLLAALEPTADVSSAPSTNARIEGREPVELEPRPTSSSGSPVKSAPPPHVVAPLAMAVACSSRDMPSSTSRPSKSLLSPPTQHATASAVVSSSSFSASTSSTSQPSRSGLPPTTQAPEVVSSSSGDASPSSAFISKMTKCA